MIKKATSAASIILPDAMASQDVRRLFRVLGSKNLRFVGGCVRNVLMELPVGDIDFATTLTPDQIVEKLTAQKIKYVPTGIDHGTVTAVMGGKGYEITTLRRDVETDGRHAKVQFTDDWAEDAARRDFTVNALYADLDGHIYDPLGSGCTDVEKRKIRFIGNAEERITEDALRILRFFRFYTYYGRGKPDAKSLVACAKLSGNMDKLSRERVTKEFFVTLLHPSAPKTLQVMADHKILPAIIPKNIDTGRIASLIKIQNRAKPQEKDIILASRLFLLCNAQSNKLVSDDSQLILNKKIISALDVLSAQKYKTLRIDNQKIGELLYFHGPALTRAIIDMTATLQNENPTAWIKHIAKMPVPIFPVKGKDLLKIGIEPGPAMGAQLKKLEARWIKSEFTLTKSDLI